VPSRQNDFHVQKYPNRQHNRPTIRKHEEEKEKRRGKIDDCFVFCYN
jgi:hypothetical protein